MLFDLLFPSNLQEFLPFSHNFSQALVYLPCWKEGMRKRGMGMLRKISLLLTRIFWIFPSFPRVFGCEKRSPGELYGEFGYSHEEWMGNPWDSIPWTMTRLVLRLSPHPQASFSHGRVKPCSQPLQELKGKHSQNSWAVGKCSLQIPSALESNSPSLPFKWIPGVSFSYSKYFYLFSV